MAQTTVAQFATELRIPADALLEQLRKAGVVKGKTDDFLSEQDKSKLLEFLRRSHGEGDGKTKITLTRKETTEIKSHDSHGKSRTVQVEVRKKRVLVKRDMPEAIPDPRSEVKLPVEPEEPVVLEPTVGVAPEPVVEVVVLPPVVETAPAPVVEEIAEGVPQPVVEPEAVEEKPKSSHKSKDKAAENKADSDGDAKSGSKKVVTRASIIGEEQQKLRAEEERRNAALRAHQEAEYRAKQQRIADLARLKREAEEKATAARTAEAAKLVAAQTASDKPSEDKTLHKPASKSGAADKKSAEKKDQWKNEGASKRQGLKTRGATGGTGWRENKHGKRPARGPEVEEAHAFQAPTEAVVYEVHVPETISVSDLAHKMSVKATEVIKTLMKMGSMVTINQVLDQETAMIIVEEMGHKAFAAKLDDPDAFINEMVHKDAVAEP